MAEARHRFQVTEQLAAPPDEVFTYLTDEFFGLWPGKAERLKEGNDPAEPSGLGFVRRMHTPAETLDEEIVTHERPRLIEYRIINEARMHNHLGRLELSEHDDGTRLVYTITFDSRPGWLGGITAATLRGVWAVKGHRVLRKAFPG